MKEKPRLCLELWLTKEGVVGILLKRPKLYVFLFGLKRTGYLFLKKREDS